MHYHFAEKIGGAEVQAILLARELARRGFKVSYVSQKLKKKAKDVEEADGVTIHWIPESKGFQAMNYRHLNRVMKEINSDIYYNRIASSYTGIVAKFCKRNGKTFVFASSEDKHCEKDYFLNTVREELRGYQKSILKKCLLRINARVENALYYEGLKKADVRLTQNSYQKNLLQENFSLSSTKVPSGHSVPENTFEKDKVPLVVWIATLTKKKQPDLFINLAKACEGLNCRFVMAGKPTTYNSYEVISSMASGVPNLDFLGEISFEKSNALLERSAVLVNTSKPHREGFPNVFVQAMMRKNAILTLHTDPDEIIEANEIGFKCSSITVMQERLKFLINNPDKLSMIAERARTFAIDNCSIEQVVDRLEKAFSEALVSPENNMPVPDHAVKANK